MLIFNAYSAHYLVLIVYAGRMYATRLGQTRLNKL